MSQDYADHGSIGIIERGDTLHAEMTLAGPSEGNNKFYEDKVIGTYTPDAVSNEAAERSKLTDKLLINQKPEPQTLDQLFRKAKQAGVMRQLVD